MSNSRPPDYLSFLCPLTVEAADDPGKSMPRFHMVAYPPLPRSIYPTSQYNGDGYGGYGTSIANFAEAKASAQADWALDNEVQQSGWSHAMSLLSNYTWSPQYRARLSRRQNHVTLWLPSGAWTSEGTSEPPMTIDHYVRPVAPDWDGPGTFDDYGDGLTADAWQQVLSGIALAHSQDWYRSVTPWGNDPSVLPTPWPADPPSGDSNVRGWVLDVVPSGVIPGNEHVAEFSLVQYEYEHRGG